jgi:hypothetical protein
MIAELLWQWCLKQTNGFTVGDATKALKLSRGTVGSYVTIWRRANALKQIGTRRPFHPFGKPTHLLITIQNIRPSIYWRKNGNDEEQA